MEPTHNSAHSSSSVLSKNVSLPLDVESPDNPPSTGISTEMARILARAPDRAACVNTGIADKSEGTRWALKRTKQCISTCVASSVERSLRSTIPAVEKSRSDAADDPDAPSNAQATSINNGYSSPRADKNLSTPVLTEAEYVARKLSTCA